ncbi:MAG: glycoside hydrolase family 32 protein [Sporolactobacillus sp.]
MEKKIKLIYLFLGLTLVCVLLIGLLFGDADRQKQFRSSTSDKPITTLRSAFHFTVPDHWMNDPQRPIYFNGAYHFFYLYNADYPHGSGTAWRQATSGNLVDWHDQGVAIPKFTTASGDVWSGSVVRDVRNTAGFGKNTLIALVTQQPKDTNQQQYLWYSKNGGKSFRPFSSHPVLANPGVKDFRDPKVIRDNADNKWVMLLAEGTKIGFYESADLKSWRYMSGFETRGGGLIECPDLFVMKASDGTRHWVLGASANGKSIGLPNTYAYWTGQFDGTMFQADAAQPQWLDYGFDWYAAVTFTNSQAKGGQSSRYAMAWMNNWDYPNETPTNAEGFNGVESVVRQIRLSNEEGRYQLLSQPLAALEKRMHPVAEIRKLPLQGSQPLDLHAVAYQLDVDLSWKDAENIGLRLRESADGKRHIDVGVFAKDHYLYVNRGQTDQPDKTGRYTENRIFLPANQHVVHLKILIDRTSIEVFANQGRIAITDLVFPPEADNRVSLFSLNGRSIFQNLTIRTFQ